MKQQRSRIALKKTPGEYCRVWGIKVVIEMSTLCAKILCIP